MAAVTRFHHLNTFVYYFITVCDLHNVLTRYCLELNAIKVFLFINKAFLGIGRYLSLTFITVKDTTLVRRSYYFLSS